VKIQKSKNKGKKAKPYAVISVRSLEDLEHLISSEIRVKGKALTIKKFKSETELKAERHREIQKRVFINNLSHKIREKDVREAVSRFGEVESIKIGPKNGSVTARVTFASRHTRDLCLTKGTFPVAGEPVLAEEQRVYDEQAREAVAGSTPFQRGPSSANSGLPSILESRAHFEEDWNGFETEKAAKPQRSFQNLSTLASMPRLATSAKVIEPWPVNDHMEEKQNPKRVFCGQGKPQAQICSRISSRAQKDDKRQKFDWFGFARGQTFTTSFLMIKENGQRVTFEDTEYRLNFESFRARRARIARMWKPFLGPNLPFGPGSVTTPFGRYMKQPRWMRTPHQFLQQ
jgi:hypothetical protein